jgi:gas vesicle protein
MQSGKVLLGALVGVAVGATIGVLFAPDKGAATRKKIAKKSDDYAGDVSQKFNGFIDGVAKKVEKLKTDASRIAENGKEKMEELVESTTSSAKTKAEEIKSGVTSAVNNSKSKVW